MHYKLTVQCPRVLGLFYWCNRVYTVANNLMLHKALFVVIITDENDGLNYKSTSLESAPSTPQQLVSVVLDVCSVKVIEL